MRPRSKAVALSVSLVIAASGGGTAAATARPAATRDAAAPALLQDAGQALGEDEGAQDEGSGAGDLSA